MKTPTRPLILCVLTLLSILTASAQEAGGRGQAERKGGPRQPVPAMPTAGAADVILGRPTPSSITLSLLRYDRDGKVVVTYAIAEKPGDTRNTALNLKKDQPQELTLNKLTANQGYSYQVKDAESGKALLNGSFRTGRASGERFVFTLTADSHLDGNTDAALYQRTLANVRADAPDFHLDLGDTFMTGKHESRENAALQYRAQRIYFGQALPSVPLFLVLGNHDGEESRLLRDGADSLAAWANAMRKRTFPNPLPDAFYSGDDQADARAGLLQDYYAWTWGNALFIVLNPYWHGDSRRGDERWDLSLGARQYQWLKTTLAGSKARYKFVFVHQLVGGRDRQGRGGIEAASFGEWGGRNADGSEGFAQHRPGWEMPIHPLLQRYGVSAVFHGHDHLYAAQTLDGIVYQEVPQPGHPGEGTPRNAAEYGYQSGIILGGAGHLRITVAPDKATVDFVRARNGAQGNGANGNGEIAHSYTIAPAR